MVYFVFLTRLQRCVVYICCREAELKVIPVFTTLDDNLQHLIELSMAATVAEQAAWLPCVRILLPNDVVIIINL